MERENSLDWPQYMTDTSSEGEHLSMERKAELSLRERTYRALTEIAKESGDDDTTEEVVMEAVLNWTTDPVDDDAILGPDAGELFSYIVNHLHSQVQAEHGMKIANEVISKINDADVNPLLLAKQDKNEWLKLVGLLGDKEDEIEIPDTLDDLLNAAGEDAPEEGTAEEYVRKVLLEKIDQHAKVGQLLAQFLMAAYTDEHETVHSMLDLYGCGLVHAVTALLFTYIESRHSLPDDVDMTSWIADISATSARVMKLPEEERLEIAKHFLNDHEGDGEDEDEDWD